jgi:hypothetical protein
MDVRQAEQIKDFIAAVTEKGDVDNVNITSFSTQPNGTVVIKVEQYFHFFPQKKETK